MTEIKFAYIYSFVKRNFRSVILSSPYICLNGPLEEHCSASQIFKLMFDYVLGNVSRGN